MKISHLGKNGDLVYALPVIKALARIRGEPITIFTSPLCYQIVPLLWEQPYIKDVEIDYSRSYKIKDNCIDPWNVLEYPDLNLSPQPAMYRPSSPRPYTHAYMEIAGIETLEIKDRIAFPTLWNHRQWYWEHKVEYADKPTWTPPKTVVLAPESESLKTVPNQLWDEISISLSYHYDVYIVGQQRGSWSYRNTIHDLRGLTTVSSMARLLAEAHAVISSPSLPFHIARHCGTPTFAFCITSFERFNPIDTPFKYVVPENWKPMVDEIISFAEKPVTTWWKKRDLDIILNSSS